MGFALAYHPDVRRIDLPVLDRRTKARIKKAIEERLQIAPQDYGKPLRRTLKGYWKLRVGDYRVVFKVAGKEVRILCICHRRDVYDRTTARAVHEQPVSDG